MSRALLSAMQTAKQSNRLLTNLKQTLKNLVLSERKFWNPCQKTEVVSVIYFNACIVENTGYTLISIKKIRANPSNPRYLRAKKIT
jgi:hypothetical protein